MPTKRPAVDVLQPRALSPAEQLVARMPKPIGEESPQDLENPSTKLENDLNWVSVEHFNNKSRKVSTPPPQAATSPVDHSPKKVPAFPPKLVQGAPHPPVAFLTPVEKDAGSLVKKDAGSPVKKDAGPSVPSVVAFLTPVKKVPSPPVVVRPEWKKFLSNSTFLGKRNIRKGKSTGASSPAEGAAAVYLQAKTTPVVATATTSTTSLKPAPRRHSVVTVTPVRKNGPPDWLKIRPPVAAAASSQVAAAASSQVAAAASSRDDASSPVVGLVLAAENAESPAIYEFKHRCTKLRKFFGVFCPLCWQEP